MNRVDYSTLIDVEKAIMKLNRLERKVNMYHNRKFLDYENHERREARKIEK